MQGKKTTIHDKQTFLEALKKRKGIVTLACKEVSLSPMTFYKWLKVDPKFAQEADEIRDVEIGIIAEDRLAEAIIVKGDLNAVKFYLQSRNRKYMQKIQTETCEDPTKSTELRCFGKRSANAGKSPPKSISGSTRTSFRTP